MTTGSVQLYQIAQGVADANGNLTMTIRGPFLSRTWQGTISIIGAPQGSEFDVTVGAQLTGTMNAPGPAGPFQLLTGQNLVVTGVGLTVGLTCTLVLTGVDDPKENPTPYTGPSIPAATAVVSSSVTGAVTLISSNVLAGPLPSVAFGPIPRTYNHLRLVCVARSAYAAQADGFLVRLNGDGGANYDMALSRTTGTAVPANGGNYAGIGWYGSNLDDMPALNATANVAGTLILDMPLYAGVAFDKTGIWASGYDDAVTATADTSAYNGNVKWRNIAAITSITVSTWNIANFVTGSAFYLYGIL